MLQQKYLSKAAASRNGMSKWMRRKENIEGNYYS